MEAAQRRRQCGSRAAGIVRRQRQQWAAERRRVSAAEVAAALQWQRWDNVKICEQGGEYGSVDK